MRPLLFHSYQVTFFFITDIINVYKRYHSITINITTTWLTDGNDSSWQNQGKSR